MTSKHIESELKGKYGVTDLDLAEIFVFCSPFLTCVETAASICSTLKVDTINVQDQLSEMLMKAWFPEDPFLNLAVKLTSNKEQFSQFLRHQYHVPSLHLDYKRQPTIVSYPETTDQTYKRFRNFYR